jgi:Asp-tRNA(Asn)/Glu-tRNA(Gln) amidotransferase B subunit
MVEATEEGEIEGDETVSVEEREQHHGVRVENKN